MPATKTIELFQYSELTGTAQETAKAWWIEAMDSSDYEYVIDDFVTIAALVGVEVKMRDQPTMGGGSRPFPQVYWSLGYTQSDFAAFEGSYAYVKGAAKAVRKHAPEDAKLHAIADALQAIQAKNFYKLTAKISERRDSLAVEVENQRHAYMEATEAAETAVTEALRDFARWLYDRLRDEHEYMTSDEQIAEAMEANEYTFRSDGRRED